MNEAGVINRLAEIVAVALVVAALALIEILIGGTRLIYSLPAYAVIGLVGLTTFFTFRAPKPRPSQICLISSLIFFGYILVRAFFSPVAYTARPDVYSVIGGLILYWFIALVCTSAKPRAWIVICLLGLALVHVLIGAVQFRDGKNFMPISFLQRFDYGRRASGFYICPNHLAGALEVLGIFGTSLVCWSRFPTWGKLLIAYASGVCYVGVLLTGSRGGYASVIASFLVFGALSLLVLRRAGMRLFWSVGGIGALAALVLAGSALLFIKKSHYLAERANNALSTAPIRLDLWHAAIEEWKAAPLLGTGSGTYLYYGRKFRTERMQQDPIYAHNDYLHLLGEYGAVGGALLLIFLGAHLHNGWKNFQRLGPKRIVVSHSLLSTSLALNLGALGAVAAYIVHSFVDFNLHIPANVLLLAFVFGILANAGVARDAEDSAMPTSILWWRGVTAATGLFLFVQCVRLLPGEYFAESARIALRHKHAGTAVHLALCGLATEQSNPNLYDYLGGAHIVRGDARSKPEERAWYYRRAIEAFEQGRKLAPLDEGFVLQLGYTYDALGRFTEGEWMYDEALRLDPKSISTKQDYEEHLKRWREAGSSPKQ